MELGKVNLRNYWAVLPVRDQAIRREAKAVIELAIASLLLVHGTIYGIRLVAAIRIVGP